MTKRQKNALITKNLGPISRTLEKVPCIKCLRALGFGFKCIARQTGLCRKRVKAVMPPQSQVARLNRKRSVIVRSKTERLIEELQRRSFQIDQRIFRRGDETTHWKNHPIFRVARMKRHYWDNPQKMRAAAKMNYIRHKATILKRNRTRDEEARKTINARYVKRLLCSAGIPARFVTPDLIALKQICIQRKREQRTKGTGKSITISNPKEPAAMNGNPTTQAATPQRDVVPSTIQESNARRATD